VDTVVGTAGNDTISGVAQYDSTLTNSINTLSALDQIDGGAGVDTLNVTDEVANIAVPATATVVNVENAVFRAALDLTADVSEWTGLTSFNAAVVGGDLDLTAADGVVVTVGNLDGNADIADAETVTISDAAATSNIAVQTGTITTAVSITGGNDIEIDRDAAVAGAALANTANSTTVASVTIDGAVGSARIESDALTSLSLANLETTGESVTVDNANANGHDLALTLDNVGYDEDGVDVGTVTVADATAEALNVTMVSDSTVALDFDAATALTIAGAGELDIDTAALAADDALETVTVSGAAAISADLSGVSSLTSVNASASTVGNTLVVANTVEAVSTGSGDDSVEYTGAISADTVVTLGAGDDTFTIAAASTDGASVDAGEGSDTLAIANGAFADTAAEAGVFSNFEVLDITGGQGTYEMDVLELNQVVINGALNAAGAVINGAAAGTTVTATSVASTNTNLTGALTYALADDTGTADSFTFTMNAVDGDDDDTAEGQITVPSLTADGIETISIVSNVTPDADDPDTPAADESVAAADYTNTITSLDGDAAKTINISGAASTDVTLAAGAVNVTKVDASTATGNVTVDQSASTKSVTFLGGSGDDDVTATGNGDLLVGNAGADTFTLGAGDDTVRYAADGDSALTLTDADEDGTADGFEGVDVISGFSSTNDKIELSSALGLATGDARTAINATAGSISGDYTADATLIATDLEALLGDGVDFFNDGATDRAVATVVVNDTNATTQIACLCSLMPTLTVTSLQPTTWSFN